MKEQTHKFGTKSATLIKVGLLVLALGILPPVCGELAWRASGFDDGSLGWLIAMILLNGGLQFIASLGLFLLTIGAVWFLLDVLRWKRL